MKHLVELRRLLEALTVLSIFIRLHGLVEFERRFGKGQRKLFDNFVVLYFIIFTTSLSIKLSRKYYIKLNRLRPNSKAIKKTATK